MRTNTRTVALGVLLSFAIASSSHAQTRDHETALELGPVPPPPVAMRESADKTIVRGIAGWSIAAAGWFGLALTGELAMRAADSACAEDSPGYAECYNTAIGASVSLVAASGLALVPLTVWGLGRHMDGEGELGWTILGHFLGSLAWLFPVGAATMGIDGLAIAGTCIFAAVAQLTGAVLGFELFASDDAESGDAF